MIESCEEIGIDAGIEDLCEIIREECAAIHRYLRHGHLAKVYENALAHRLRGQAMVVEQQYPLSVYDEDGTHLGSFVADLVVEGTLLVELKTCPALRPEHLLQTTGYLAAAQLAHGLVINFGAPALELRRLFRAAGR
ncbi:MAG: GxxExxY protein [Blastocatellia bacterium]|nr:GxxExxY protein [Blastocatellia bacterium]